MFFPCHPVQENPLKVLSNCLSLYILSESVKGANGESRPLIHVDGVWKAHPSLEQQSGLSLQKVNTSTNYSIADKEACDLSSQVSYEILIPLQDDIRCMRLS